MKRNNFSPEITIGIICCFFLQMQKALSSHFDITKLVDKIREKRKKYNIQAVLLRIVIMFGILFAWYFGIYKRENKVQGTKLPNLEITFLAFFLVYINFYSIVIHFTKIIFPNEEHVKSSKFVVYVVEVITQLSVMGPSIYSLFDIYKLDNNHIIDGVTGHSSGLCLVNTKHILLPGSAYVMIDNVTDFANSFKTIGAAFQHLDIYYLPVMIVSVMYICELILQNTSMRYELQLHHYLVLMIYYVGAYTELSIPSFKMQFIEVLFMTFECPLFMFLIYYRVKIKSNDPKETPLIIWQNTIRFITFVCIWWAVTRTILMIWVIYEYVNGFDYLPFEAKVLWLLMIILQAITLGFTQNSVMQLRKSCIRKMKKAYFPNNQQYESARFSWKSRRDLVSTRNLNT